MLSGCVATQNSAEMTPEQKLYNLSIQQSLEDAHKYNATPEGQAMVRARIQHDAQVQADRDSAEGAEINRRLSPNYQPPPPPEQHMCSINYGSTVGLVPCP